MGRNFKKNILRGIAGLVIFVIAGPLPALAFVPHEDPEKAERVFSAISLFRYYSASLDLVLKMAPEEVKAHLEKMPFANVPEEISPSANKFASSGMNLSDRLAAVDQGLGEMRTLIGQFRLNEAPEMARSISSNISAADGELMTLEDATVASWRILTTWSPVPEGTDLSISYDEVIERIERIRQLIDLYRSLQANLLLATTAAQDPKLKPTDITLSTGPRAAFVGEEIPFEGRLSSEGEPLAGREVDILLDGVRYMTVTTDGSGYYGGLLSLPYRYQPEVSLQALYYPRGEDVGLYLAALSPVIKLTVLYYQARLEIGVDDKVYPGREASISGRFDYGESPPPQERKIEIFLDDLFVAAMMAGEAFTAEISIAPEMDIGEHTVTLSAIPAGRYAPVTAVVTLDVVKAIPVVEADVPGLALVPGSIPIRGRLYSEIGPLNGATVRIRLGTSDVELISSADGSFDGRIKMGLSLGLIGWQDLEMEVIPLEPWHASVDTTKRVLVLNIINSSGFLVVVALLGIYLPSRLRRRLGQYPGRAERPVATATRPVLAPAYSRQIAVAAVDEPGGEEGREPMARVLYWYRRAVRLLQGMTEALLPPHQTLREFANERSRVLGPFARYFIELTRMVERFIYSSRRPTEEDVENSRRLAQDIEGAIKGESV